MAGIIQLQNGALSILFSSGINSIIFCLEYS